MGNYKLIIHSVIVTRKSCGRQLSIGWQAESFSHFPEHFEDAVIFENVAIVFCGTSAYDSYCSIISNFLLHALNRAGYVEPRLSLVAGPRMHCCCLSSSLPPSSSSSCSPPPTCVVSVLVLSLLLPIIPLSILIFLILPLLLCSPICVV